MRRTDAYPSVSSAPQSIPTIWAPVLIQRPSPVAAVAHAPPRVAAAPVHTMRRKRVRDTRPYLRHASHTPSPARPFPAIHAAVSPAAATYAAATYAAATYAAASADAAALTPAASATAPAAAAR